MLDPKEFHEKLVDYPESNLLTEEHQAIEMIFNLLRQLFGYSIDKLSKEGEKHKIEMTRIVAVVSAALVKSNEGMANYLKANNKIDDSKPISKWKMAGRYNQIARRPPR